MNNEKTFKFIKYLSYILLGLGLLTFVYFAVASLLEPEPSTEFLGSVGAAKGVDIMLYYAYFIFAVALILVLLFPLISIIRNPKNAGRTLIGFVVLVILFVVTYLLGSTTPVVNSAGGYFDNPAVLKLTDMGLYTTYIVFAAAIVIILWGEIRRAFK